MSQALIFSGQGSQYVGMARDISDHYPEVASIITKANTIVGYNLSSVMFNGPDDVLRQTKYTQPALFLHEAAILEVTKAHQNVSAVAGHSLGEYSALYAAGVLSFDDALQLVQLRANLMFSEGERITGTMVAVVGLDDATVRAVCEEVSSGPNAIVVPANFNSPGQVVVSGSADHLRLVMPVFKERGAKLVKELQVSGAFHSPLLQAAESALAERIRATPFNNAAVPVYVNVSAQPVTQAEDLRESAIRQLTQPVLWTDTMNNMWSHGITSFCEIGPGKVLQGLVKRTLEGAVVRGVDTLADIERELAGASS